jgi:hypothetical protein
MFKIQLFLRRNWDDVEKVAAENHYFPLDDIASVRKIFSKSFNGFYTYGKVIIGNDYQILVDAECELDCFISCIQDDRQAIFSGSVHVIDNSYFKLAFHYVNKLTIAINSKKLVVEKHDFINAFREVAGQYYTLLADFKINAAYYHGQAQQVRTDWQLLN